MPRKNRTKDATPNYTTEYIHLPHRTDLKRITLEPTKTICINMDAMPWGWEHVVKHFDDELLRIIRKKRGGM